MLEDLRALVEFAHAGSIAGAADRLFRTPSAITRQVQRLAVEGTGVSDLSSVNRQFRGIAGKTPGVYRR
jgi:Bacterial regulatory helix-turn-helix protein, lysR family